MIQYADMHLCVHAIKKSIYIQCKYNYTLLNQLQYTMNIQLRNSTSTIFNKKARGEYLIKISFFQISKAFIMNMDRSPFLFSGAINSFLLLTFSIFFNNMV